MGRGRARAKQAKVARELKYHAPATDFAALERELSVKIDRPLDEPDDFAYDGDHDRDRLDEREFAQQRPFPSRRRG
ncbi:DUF3073 domain-containing protein [Streptomyces pactum]|uniref:DUF3073 domain-containing protein n=1 Tax=Streptomyces pactum TaxID=68249 RepID=A0ABS0NLT6_9ACTN|nr:DUF3073 domain-containing protein [Streptomyces pactum]MBH5336155.1 DUF3073 domain-containing protein [Streptomyces pactum]